MAAKPSPFIGNLYEMTHAGVACINWSADGHSFSVSSPEAFARDVLPTYAKHNNYASFVRQLNMYGFRRTTENKKGTQILPGMPLVETFSHPSFTRNHREKLSQIRRKTPASMPRRTKSAADSDDDVSDISLEDQQQLSSQSTSQLQNEIHKLRSECDKTQTQMQWLMAQNQLLVAQQKKQSEMLHNLFLLATEHDFLGSSNSTISAALALPSKQDASIASPTATAPMFFPSSAAHQLIDPLQSSSTRQFELPMIKIEPFDFMDVSSDSDSELDSIAMDLHAELTA